MLSENETVRLSKFLSLVLRHKPQTIGIILDEQGWVSVDSLLQKLMPHGYAVDRAVLQHVVDTNNKKRFAFSDDGTQIRASQGHSIAVDLGYEPAVPPPVLYHGTAERNIPSIMKEGLKKGNRQHVHLSVDKDTAVKVGQRHGRPFIFLVMAEQMHRDGYVFYLSANGVWLTEAVPANFLKSL